MRGEHDAALRRAEELTSELTELEGAAGRLAELEKVAVGLGESEEALTLVEAVVRAHQGADAVRLPDRPEAPDEEAGDQARTEADRLRSEAAELDGRLAGGTGRAGTGRGGGGPLVAAVRRGGLPDVRPAPRGRVRAGPEPPGG